MEEWKDINGYEGQYQISNCGRVKSLARDYFCGYQNRARKHQPEIILYQSTNLGYKLVGLSRDNKCFTGKVHRLVAQAFIPNPDNLPEVNHKDGDKSNNNDWNLEWSTPKDNSAHARSTGLCNQNGENAYHAKLTNQQAEEIRALKGIVSHRKIAEMYGACRTTIGNIMLNKSYK